MPLCADPPLPGLVLTRACMLAGGGVQRNGPITLPGMWRGEGGAGVLLGCGCFCSVFRRHINSDAYVFRSHVRLFLSRTRTRTRTLAQHTLSPPFYLRPPCTTNTTADCGYTTLPLASLSASAPPNDAGGVGTGSLINTSCGPRLRATRTCPRALVLPAAARTA